MRSKAFTLIELLVVIAIMTILIGLSAFGLQQARESARDGQRKSDLETIRTGLSFYKADCNAYPTPTSGDFKTVIGTSLVGVAASCGGTANTYIAKVPSDPVPGNLYYFSSTGTTYYICASLETGDAVAVAGCPSGSTGCGGYCNYIVTNP
ncbi:MAG: hypothetical protein US75_C0001G0042 [Candidatus Woesebacteria bacterium GW2011_GWC1_38_13]|uniref:General secretion pathway protein G n=3 Tax=Candidatus Woeseibacteriota TaxID=1752722 RepID=A0A0G0KV43_9BACT|nr:MAG: hypothetical protein US67_C0026G0006 [Candidatus Woesebacteria bacterium GW2011_GWD1_38_10]KKQ56985.1 MAG: hypothetical protein US75_C0001G0042 [Candidatus Woesebacteria bacterium GW2011_GWC1_38_13]KKQ74851.1 MAG: hypothetical protein US97_C0055G0004 [Microgenomates group bacterium GW2011_GWF1_38_5]KKQ83558.1 MAG: hypothetical protein UT06_C0020G0021 [Candidatus Woesebacteria bacterium GW2011_GWA1_38_8]